MQFLKHKLEFYKHTVCTYMFILIVVVFIWLIHFWCHKRLHRHRHVKTVQHSLRNVPAIHFITTQKIYYRSKTAGLLDGEKCNYHICNQTCSVLRQYIVLQWLRILQWENSALSLQVNVSFPHYYIIYWLLLDTWVTASTHMYLCVRSIQVSIPFPTASSYLFRTRLITFWN